MEPIDAYKDEDTMAGVYNAWSKCFIFIQKKSLPDFFLTNKQIANWSLASDRLRRDRYMNPNEETF